MKLPTPPAIESQSLETAGQVKAIMAGDLLPASSTPTAGRAGLDAMR
jgi:hypothetical protein